MPHFPDDLKLWRGNIPSRMSMADFQRTLLHVFRVDVHVLPKGIIDERRNWAIIIFKTATAAQAFQNAYDGQQPWCLGVPWRLDIKHTVLRMSQHG